MTVSVTIVMSSFPLEDFLNVEDNLICTKRISDKDIENSIMNEHLEDPSDEENEISRPLVKQTSE